MIKTNKLVMIPGPTPVVRSIQDQMARETVAFGDAAFVKDFSEVIADLKAMWRCDGEVFVVAGSGTMGMEMAIANTTKRGDNILICSNGFFGDRFIDMCTRKGLNTMSFPLNGKIGHPGDGGEEAGGEEVPGGHRDHVRPPGCGLSPPSAK